LLPAGLWDALAHAQVLGLIGPGPLAGHVDHSLGFVWAVETALGRVPESVVDLGSGGGLPGLVAASLWNRAAVVLVEAGQRRAEHLRTSLSSLPETGATVAEGRAEELGRDRAFRAQADVVTARSFGRPPVVAECGAAFLHLGGRLVVSEPPEGGGSGERWPPSGLALVGLSGPELISGPTGEARFAVMVKHEPTPDRFPRRSGVPAKRPLF
jgi:16S rRNA (guanine527-N7)-methyltransferase